MPTCLEVRSADAVSYIYLLINAGIHTCELSRLCHDYGRLRLLIDFAWAQSTAVLSIGALCNARGCEEQQKQFSLCAFEDWMLGTRQWLIAMAQVE